MPAKIDWFRFNWCSNCGQKQLKSKGIWCRSCNKLMRIKPRKIPTSDRDLLVSRY